MPTNNINNYKNKNLNNIQYNNQTWIGITITDSATSHILELMKQDKDMLGIHLNIKKSGCAGFTYVLNKTISTDDTTKDIIYYKNGAAIYIALHAMPFIDGTEIDYSKNNLNSTFIFNNPKAIFSCGCGISFNIFKGDIN